jgi:chromosome segregation ATPase
MSLMRDSDELTDIPPIVPSRDDVTTHQQARRGQSQEIVRPTLAQQKVSTWPVRIALLALALAMLGAGGMAYNFYGQYQDELRQADLRISDLERRLSLVGAENEDSVVNIQETLDFHFSEIDKLWAARNALRTEAQDIRGELSRLELANEGQDEVVANLAQQVDGANTQINAGSARVNTLVGEMDQLTQQLTEMDASLANLASLRTELQSVQTALNSGDSNLLGVIGRLEYLEGSMESVNAHRLQINETLFRLQENLEAIQRQAMPAGL